MPDTARGALPQLDLPAYFRRIAWTGEARADLATLAGLLLAHMDHVPFENLDVLLGRGVQLDLASLQRKLVQDRRGGYCFEHATLLGAVLEALGFVVRRHTARVVQFTPRHLAPRSHMFLVVELPEGAFVADPGFGGLAAPFPVPLADAAHDHDATHWLERDGASWTLRTRAFDKVVDCWVTTLEAENAVDFEVSNHYTSTHPASPFVNRIAMQARWPGGRATVRNRTFTLWDGATVASTRELAHRSMLREVVARHFGFDLAEIESLRVPEIPEWR